VGEHALGQNDDLLGQILYSLNVDCQWHRDWSRELVQVFTADNPSNKDAIRGWISKWRPRTLLAVDAIAGLFESKPIGRGENLFFTISRSRATISGLNSLRARLLKEAGSYFALFEATKHGLQLIGNTLVASLIIQKSLVQLQP
jgi:hypothetical protein